MPTTVNELKALYVHLGGVAEDVADVTLIPQMIAAISELDIAHSDFTPIQTGTITEIVNSLT